MKKQEYETIAKMIEYNFDFDSVTVAEIHEEYHEILIYFDEKIGSADLTLHFSDFQNIIFVGGGYSSQSPCEYKKDDPHHMISSFLFSIIFALKALKGEEGIMKRSKQKFMMGEDESSRGINLIYEVFDENSSYGTMVHDFSRF